MKLEFFLLCITGFVVMNIYHDGKYMKLLISWKKYYKMAVIILIGLGIAISSATQDITIDALRIEQIKKNES